MSLVAVACLLLSVVSVRCQPTIESDTCSFNGGSVSDAVYSAVSEFRLHTLQFEQRQHQLLHNLTQEFKSFIHSALLQPVYTVPARREQDRGISVKLFCL